jgi:hypothetical protein
MIILLLDLLLNVEYWIIINYDYLKNVSSVYRPVELQ